MTQCSSGIQVSQANCRHAKLMVISERLGGAPPWQTCSTPPNCGSHIQRPSATAPRATQQLAARHKTHHQTSEGACNLKGAPSKARRGLDTPPHPTHGCADVLERGRRTFDEHWLGGAAAGVVKMLFTSMSSAMTSEPYSCSGGGRGRPEVDWTSKILPLRSTLLPYSTTL